MSTSLAGIDLNPNLYLRGVEDRLPVYSTVRPLLGGNNAIQIQTNLSGTSLELVATPGDPRIGEFCQHQLDALAVIAEVGNTVTLIHPRKTAQVYILGFDTEQLEVREPSGPNKKYSGVIILQEV